MKNIRKFIAALIMLQFAYSVSAQTTLPTFWSFVNPSPTGSSTSDPASPPTPGPTGWYAELDLFVTGSTPFTYATGQDGNASCRLDATSEYVMVWFTDKPGPISYYLKGTGISPNPAFSGIFSIQEGPDTSHWTDMQSVTTMTGSFVRYLNNPLPTTRCIRFYYTSKVSGSNVALDSIYIQAAPASPNATINVKQSTASIVNGSTYVVGKTASTLFKIENNGTSQALTLSNKTITGTNASDYTVNYFPSSIASNSTDTFSVTFNPLTSGTKKATLSFANNDSLKNPFVINLYGIGGSYATEPLSQPTNLTFSNLKAYTLSVTYRNAAGAAPEKYIVLRKKGSAITDIPVDGQTYVRGDYIGTSQVAYVGSDTSFIPRNIIANSTYNFSVFAFNGPSGFENYLTTSALAGSITSTGSNIGSYYGTISSAAPTFVNDLHAKINVHDTIFYSNYTTSIVDNFIARDTTGGKKIVNCVYSTLPYVYNDPFMWWTGTGGNLGTLTREHSFCQSWMPSNVGNPNWPNGANGKELPEYNDQHHLFPADQLNANGKRSNYPFGEVVTPTYTSSTGMGKLGLDSAGNTVYEPRDAHKGDLARALFYMCTAYNGVNSQNWSLPAQQKQAVLKKWHFQDPPDAWEIARHEYINSIQHNRNPFIDSIYWVNKIDFSTMTLISSSVAGITLSSPVGGENWYANHNYNITWASANVDSVKIELLLNDTVYKVISPRTLASAGTLAWLISPNSLSSTKAKIRLTDTKSATVSTSANYFTITSTVGVNEINIGNHVSVYPNPSQGNVVVNVDMPIVNSSTINVFDITGKLLQSIETKENATTLNIEGKGVFIVQVKANNGVTYKKVVIE